MLFFFFRLIWVFHILRELFSSLRLPGTNTPLALETLRENSKTENVTVGEWSWFLTKVKGKWAYVTRKKWPLWWFNNSIFVLLTVGIPAARPKSPLDPKKDGESISYSVLPLSDGPEGSTNSRPQVVVTKGKIKFYKIYFWIFFFFYMGMWVIKC